MGNPSLDNMTVYIDGNIMPGSEAKISVFDHGLLYGDGVFEGIRVYDGCIFKCDEHVDRLFESAHALRLVVPLSREEITEAMIETVRASGLRDAYLRVVVTRGVGDLGLDPTKCPRGTVIIIAGDIVLYPDEFYTKGLELVTVSTRRNTPAALSPSIKSLNYLNNVLAKIQVRDAGCLEGIMLNHEGYVAECTGDNILIVRDGVIRTPADHCGVLKGITRNTVRDLARKRGITFEETILVLPDVYGADECFLTGTAAEIIPVVAVDKRTIGDGKPGPITATLLEDFRKITTVDGRQVY